MSSSNVNQSSRARRTRTLPLASGDTLSQEFDMSSSKVSKPQKTASRRKLPRRLRESGANEKSFENGFPRLRQTTGSASGNKPTDQTLHLNTADSPDPDMQLTPPDGTSYPLAHPGPENSGPLAAGDLYYPSHFPSPRQYQGLAPTYEAIRPPFDGPVSYPPFLPDVSLHNQVQDTSVYPPTSNQFGFGQGQVSGSTLMPQYVYDTQNFLDYDYRYMPEATPSSNHSYGMAPPSDERGLYRYSGPPSTQPYTGFEAPRSLSPRNEDESTEGDL